MNINITKLSRTDAIVAIYILVDETFMAIRNMVVKSRIVGK